MNAIEVVRLYNQAWNGRDANAIVALFAEGGTYSNPHAGQGLTGGGHRQLRQSGLGRLP
jgi:nuclear transport factor 2 (NTF2) superfamily protein